MELSPRDAVAALAILIPARGRAIGGHEAIVSANLAEYQPSPEAAEAASRGFAALGFEVGPLMGICFAITAPVSRFQEAFGVPLRGTDEGGIEADGGEGEPGALPLGRLPEELTRLLQTVVFPPPPDYHAPPPRLQGQPTPAAAPTVNRHGSQPGGRGISIF